uniref:BPTI/Kunitz inhibitor domain-containing protein n=1 Tax=Glossina brevipalpis TaxID=37001 RepID=A0A1A9WUS1_9MUSC
MKSVLVLFISCAFLIIDLQAAAVKTDAEKLGKDSNVNQDNTTVNEALPEDCQQPKETGRCLALFYRFAYDMKEGKCIEFVYGGCGGNPNNFLTKQDCEQKCLKKSEVNSTKTYITTTVIADISSDTDKIKEML